MYKSHVQYITPLGISKEENTRKFFKLKFAPSKKPMKQKKGNMNLLTVLKIQNYFFKSESLWHRNIF